MRRTIQWLRLVAVLYVALAFCLPLQAQVQRSMINPSFEAPALVTPGCRVYIGEARVPGWTTNHPASAEQNVGGCVVPAGFGVTGVPLIELWRTPRNSNSGGTVDAPDGVQLAELNAEVASRLYQNVCLINGEVFRWRFTHRGRSSATVHDVANFVVGTGSSIVQVGSTNAGTFLPPVVGTGAQANTPTVANTWVNYSGVYTYAGATGITSLGFEAVSAAGGVTSGNLLDAIQIEIAPFVDFAQPTYSAPEAAGNNLPRLRINGTVYAPMAIVVSIAGGTATLGTDYTTPDNTATVTVTVPPGIYDGVSAASFFTVPLAIVNDNIVEGNETILLHLEQSATTPQSYYRRSNTNCGSAGIVDAVYTIIGDDVQLAVTKNASPPVPVAGQANLFDMTFTIVVNNTSATSNARYSLQDVPGFDPDVTIVSAGLALNGGASTALPATGPWTLQPQWRLLAPQGTDTYVVSVRGNMARAGSTVQDGCATPSVAGRGLHNAATAVLQAQPVNQSFTSTACQPTPTPYWLRLDKRFAQRAQATDQAQIRIYSGGILAASATTAGSGTTASTGAAPYAAGTTVDLRETLLVAGTATVPASKYVVSIACSNANTGSSTLLPSGTGASAGSEHAWFEFGPLGGDDIACTILNTPRAALSIDKSNGVDRVDADSVTNYQLTVKNDGPADVTGAVVHDTVQSGLQCSTITCTASSGTSCPAPAGVTWAALSATGGIVLPTMQPGSSITLTVTCTVVQ